MPRYRQYRVYPWDEDFGFSPGFYNMGGRIQDAGAAAIEPAILGELIAQGPGKTVVHLAPGDKFPVNLEHLWELAMRGQVIGIYVPGSTWEIVSFSYTDGYASKKAAREEASRMTYPVRRDGSKASFYGYVQIVSLMEQPRQCVVDWAGIVATYHKVKR